jgi:hypothetical protein
VNYSDIWLDIEPRRSGRPGIAITHDQGPETFIVTEVVGFGHTFRVKVLDEYGECVDETHTPNLLKAFRFIGTHCGAVS